jgi:hypothetical protein
MSDQIEPVGMDPVVQERLRDLENAMASVAKKAGHSLDAVALTWVTRRGDDAHGGVLFRGDDSEDVVAFMVDMLEDDSTDVELVHPLDRLQ